MRGPPGPLEAAPSPPCPVLVSRSPVHTRSFPLLPHTRPPPVPTSRSSREAAAAAAAAAAVAAAAAAAAARGVSSASAASLVRARSLAPPPPVFFLFRSFVVASPPFPSFPAKHRRMLFPCPFWRRARTRSEHSFGGREGEKNARFGDQSSSRSGPLPGHGAGV